MLKKPNLNILDNLFMHEIWEYVYDGASERMPSERDNL